MRKITIDCDKVSQYLTSNSDKPIYVVYNVLKSKKFKDLSNEEVLVLSYLQFNKRKLGLK